MAGLRCWAPIIGSRFSHYRRSSRGTTFSASRLARYQGTIDEAPAAESVVLAGEIDWLSTGVGVDELPSNTWSTHDAAGVATSGPAETKAVLAVLWCSRWCGSTAGLSRYGAAGVSVRGRDRAAATDASGLNTRSLGGHLCARTGVGALRQVERRVLPDRSNWFSAIAILAPLS